MAFFQRHLPIVVLAAAGILVLLGIFGFVQEVPRNSIGVENGDFSFQLESASNKRGNEVESEQADTDA